MAYARAARQVWWVNAVAARELADTPRVDGDGVGPQMGGSIDSRARRRLVAVRSGECLNSGQSVQP